MSENHANMTTSHRETQDGREANMARLRARLTDKVGTSAPVFEVHEVSPQSGKSAIMKQCCIR